MNAQADIQVFIKKHGKTCWESEYERGELCIGEKVVAQKLTELLELLKEADTKIATLVREKEEAERKGYEKALGFAVTAVKGQRAQCMQAYETSVGDIPKKDYYNAQYVKTGEILDALHSLNPKEEKQ